MKTKYRVAARAKRQHQGDPSAMYRLLGRIQPFTQDELTKLQLPVLMAFDDLRHGKGTRQDFSTLVAIISVVIDRAKTISPKCLELCGDAMSGLERMQERHEKTGKWGFDGTAMQDMGAVIDLYRQLLELGAPGEMIDAIRQSIGRLNSSNVLESA